MNFLSRENGNILFLILIAVALFAALSFVVVQSTRSPQSGIDKEQSGLSAGQILQYTALLKSSILRLSVSKSVSAQDINFIAPGTAGYIADKRLMFHPLGGDAPYVIPDSKIFIGGYTTGAWQFAGDLEVMNAGSTTGSSGGTDIVAILRELTPAFCEALNRELKIPNTPIINAALVFGQAATDFRSYNAAGSSHAFAYSALIDLTGNSYAVTNAASGTLLSACFQNGAGGDYIFYDVLLNR